MKNLKASGVVKIYELNCLVSLQEGNKIKEIITKIEDWIEKNKGSLVGVIKEVSPSDENNVSEVNVTQKKESHVWIEKRRLAFQVKKDKAGFYIYIWFKLDPAKVVDLNRFLKLEKEVLRFALIAEEKIARMSPNRDAVTPEDMKLLDAQPTTRFDKRFQKEEPVVKREIAEPKKKEEEVVEKKEDKKEEKQLEKEVKDSQEVHKEEVAAGENLSEEAPKDKVAPKESSVTVKEEESKPKETPKETEKDNSNKDSKAEKKEESEEKKEKRKKITLEELDQRLDDILNEDIL